MIAFLHDPVFPHTVENCGHAEFHCSLSGSSGQSLARRTNRVFVTAHAAAGKAMGISGPRLTSNSHRVRMPSCPLRPCRTIDFICCDAVHTAVAWTFAVVAVRIGVDCSRWPFFHFFYCGLFAARTAPSDTIIYILRGRSTNPRKGLAEVPEDRAIRPLGRGPAMRRIFD